VTFYDVSLTNTDAGKQNKYKTLLKSSDNNNNFIDVLKPLFLYQSLLYFIQLGL